MNISSGHRFSLERYQTKSSRHQCPQCMDRRLSFTLYIDNETGKPIHETVGRCNRLDHCGYHYTPSEFFRENPSAKENLKIDKPNLKGFKPRPIEKVKPSYIDPETFKSSLNQYSQNNFVAFLNRLFGPTETNNLIEKYFIGTSLIWPGATVYWQIDSNGLIRTGKIMLYNPDTGKRDKEKITWVHSAMRIQDFKLSQCFFGEHLLNDTSKPVAMVESEKTSIICSAFFPQFIWIATGGIQNLNEERLNSLKGRNVTLFPDLNAYKTWKDKISQFKNIASFRVDVFLENKATYEEKNNGLDLADYLINYDPKKFLDIKNETGQNIPQSDKGSIDVDSGSAQVLQNSKSIPVPIHDPSFDEKYNGWIIEDQPIKIPSFYGMGNHGQLSADKFINEDWIPELEELEENIKSVNLPDTLNLFHGEINDIPLFMERHISYCRANSGNRIFLPYMNRLRAFRETLLQNQ